MSVPYTLDINTGKNIVTERKLTVESSSLLGAATVYGVQKRIFFGRVISQL